MAARPRPSTARVFRQEIEQAGFRFKDEVAVEGFLENYLLRFVKPSADQAK